MAMLQKFRAPIRLLRNDPSRMIFSRNLADHAHGPVRVPMWEDPMSPSRWKEEHFVFVSLAGWGALFYGGYRLFTGGSKKEAPVKVEIDAKKDTSSGKDKAGKH